MHMIFERECFWAGALVIALGLGYVFRREPFGKHWSISLHASAHRGTTYVFGAALLIATALWAVYFKEWLIPRYAYGLAMQVALGMALVCLGLLAVIPHYEQKWQGRVHVLASWVMVGLMPVILLLHALDNWGSVGGYVAALSIVADGVLLGIFWGVKGMHERFALLQSLYIGIFFLCLGVFGYV